MKPPAFWRAGGEAHIAAQLLKPAAALYAAAHARNLRRARAEAVGVPIICIGNATLGGTGKTPATLALAAAFSGLGWRPHILSRGHGGALKGPLAVDGAQHRAADVGDEALLHANAAPAWVSRDRVAGARAAAEAGAGVILMDDGYQNPSLTKDVSILVIDAEAGFGNGLGFPAGPLREPPQAALSRADAVLFTGPQGAASIPPHLMRAAGPLPKFRAWLEPEGPMPPGPYLAFAGIGRPERFFTLLRQLGADVKAEQAFADHHAYTGGELRGLARHAEALGARLITTEKDFVRLPPDERQAITMLPVSMRFDDENRLVDLIAKKTGLAVPSPPKRAAP